MDKLDKIIQGIKNMVYITERMYPKGKNKLKVHMNEIAKVFSGNIHRIVKYKKEQYCSGKLSSHEVQEKMGQLYFIIMKQFYTVEHDKTQPEGQTLKKHELPEILGHLSNIITSYIVENYEEEFLRCLRTENESIALDDMYQFFCCEKLDDLLSSKYLSVLTEEKQILDLFYRFLKAVIGKVMETIDSEMAIAEFSCNNRQKMDLSLKIYSILGKCIEFSQEALLPMFKGQIYELLYVVLDLSVIEEVSN